MLVPLYFIEKKKKVVRVTEHHTCTVKLNIAKTYIRKLLVNELYCKRL